MSENQNSLITAELSCEQDCICILVIDEVEERMIGSELRMHSFYKEALHSHTAGFGARFVDGDFSILRKAVYVGMRLT